MNLVNWFGFGLAVGWSLTGGLAQSCEAAGDPTFNVRDFGATGREADDARPAIQKAIEACAAAGGGRVLLPPGEYTSGTLHLRSRVRFHLEAGATLFASPDPKAYEFGTNASKAALLFGEDLENVTIEGRGTVDGQAEYEWRDDDHEQAFDHKDFMLALGKPIRRSFPKGFPQRTIFPHLLWLGRSTNVHVTGLNFLRSPSWTLTLYACQRVVFDRLYVYSSLHEAVWADGIDLDGCREVSVSNCNIETGDDCLVFISSEIWGPALPCENVTVSNCRLASASAGIKFSEGNRLGVRRVAVNNTILSPVNRGFVLTTTLGGDITDVVLSDLIIECRRFDWFWAGDGQPFHFRSPRVSELERAPPRPGEPAPGTIRHVLVRNVLARAQGTSRLLGHAENWLQDVTFDTVKFILSTDPAAPYDKADHALYGRRIRDLRLRNVEVSWDKPALETWKSALCLEEVQGLELDGFAGRAAWPERRTPAVFLNDVADALVRRSRAPEGANLFLRVMGAGSRNIALQGNDFRHARVAFQVGKEVRRGTVQARQNLAPE